MLGFDKFKDNLSAMKNYFANLGVVYSICFFLGNDFVNLRSFVKNCRHFRKTVLLVDTSTPLITDFANNKLKF